MIIEIPLLRKNWVAKKVNKKVCKTSKKWIQNNHSEMDDPVQGNIGKISKNPLKQNLLIFPTLLKNVGKISKIRPQNNCKIWKLCKNVVKISKICNYYMWLHNLLIFPTFLVTLKGWCGRNVGKVSKISTLHTFHTILLTLPTFLRKICRENQ